MTALQKNSAYFNFRKPPLKNKSYIKLHFILIWNDHRLYALISVLTDFMRIL